MRHLFLFIFLLSCSTPIFSQKSQSEALRDFHQALLSKEPKSNLEVTIPVVLHELQWQGVSPVIGVLEANEIIEYLNFAFKEGTGPNSPSISFCLAQFDDDNNLLVDGAIEHIEVEEEWIELIFGFISTVNSSFIMNDLMPQYNWDNNKYLNIWLAPNLGGKYGSAKFPNTGALEGIDFNIISSTIGPGSIATEEVNGVVILSSLLEINQLNSLAHEIGHWLGLLHTCPESGNQCIEWDFCADTPPCFRQNILDCTVPTLVCGEIFPANNFMAPSYVSDCRSTFTPNQYERMEIALTYSPAIYSVWQHDYLCDPSTWMTAQIAQPYAVFCPGDSILLDDYIDLFTPSNYTISYSVSLDGGFSWSVPTSNPFSFAGSPSQSYTIRVIAQTGSSFAITLGVLEFTAYTIADCYWPPKEDPKPIKTKSLIISAFPNPALDIIQVKSNTPIEQIIVANATKTFQVKYRNDEPIDISNFESGVLFIHVQLLEGQAKVLKVIKK